jgi:hypothetical protein
MTDSERIARLEVIAEQHGLLLDKIDKNVESLLASRSYVRGAWKAIIVVATVVSAAVSIFIAWIKH